MSCGGLRATADFCGFLEASKRKPVRQGRGIGGNIEAFLFKKPLLAFNNQPRTGADEGNPTV